MRQYIGKTIDIVSIKYDASPHRQWQGKIVTVDDEGVLVYTKPGTVMWEPNAQWETNGGYTYYWWNRWYNAFKMLQDNDMLRYYVHIATPPLWKPGELHYVDLDVDVLANAEGRVWIEDEDEFREGIQQFGYNERIIRHVRRATDEVYAKLKEHGNPWPMLLRYTE